MICGLLPLPAINRTMLTIDDVRAIPLFSTFAVPELERLAQTSADLHLGAGEYAAHEGGEERALFAVLASKMEVVRFTSMATMLSGRGPSFLQLASPGAASRSKASIGSSARVFTMERHAAKRVRPMDSTSTSLVPETRPVRPLCTLPIMHEL